MALRAGASSDGGAHVYCLSNGKQLPTFASDRERRRELKSNEALSRRIELLQDFEFNTASTSVVESADGERIAAIGCYPPSMKLYDTAELSMKWERRHNCELVSLCALTPDLGKSAVLLADRHVVLHAAYGQHHSIRIPNFGRHLMYDAASCDLHVASAAGCIHRLSLDEGRLRAPLGGAGDDYGVNKCAIQTSTRLVAGACDDGVVRFYDGRVASRTADDQHGAPVATLRTADGSAATAVAFDPTDALTVAVGTHQGRCSLYDLRAAQPLHTKEHQYGLPIRDVHLHSTGSAGRGGGSRMVLSCDSKLVKVWARDETATGGVGAVLANVEGSADINGLTVAGVGGGGGGDSGLLYLPGEQSRVMCYYVPELGPAPRWCSFLDSITEELEEAAFASVYDDYRFVTRDELDSLGATSLVGTKMLRAYMHGYFVDAKLYNKLKAVAEPFAYEDWRKKKIKEKMAERTESRIAPRRRLPKVNAELAQKILKKKSKKKTAADGDDSDGGSGSDAEDAEDAADAEAAAAAAQRSAANPLGDDRFAAMFADADFQVDQTSNEFASRNPSGAAAAKRNARRDARRALDDGSDDDLDSDGGGAADEPGANDEQFDAASDSGSDAGSDSDSDDAAHPAPPVAPPAAAGRKRSAPSFYTLKDGVDETFVYGGGGAGGAGAGGAGGRDKRQARGPKAQRASKYELGETTEKDVPGQGMVTETTFMPAARGGGGGGGGKDGGSDRGGGKRRGAPGKKGAFKLRF